MTEPTTRSRPRDKTRVSAWSLVAVTAILGIAGATYKPMPDINAEFESARFQMTLGLYDEARVNLESVLRRDPAHQTARLCLASIQQVRGEYAAALDNFVRGYPALVALDDPAMITDFHLATGVLRIATGDFAGARQDAEWLIAAGERAAAGCLIRAFSRLGDGDDTGFRQDLTQAFAWDPTDPLFRLDQKFLAEAIPWTSAISIDRPGLFLVR